MNTAKVLQGALLLAVVLTACSATSNPSAGVPIGAGTPTARASETAGASDTPSSVAAPTLFSAAAKGVPARLPAASARRARCVSSVLRASLGQIQGAAGHSYVALLLTNRSRFSCALTGYPGVSFTAGVPAHQVGAPAQRDRRFPVVPVTLAPGATVHATMAIANYANYDQHACQPARATGYRIYPPGSTGSLLIRAPQIVCSRSGLQSFQTSVIRPGVSPD